MIKKGVKEINTKGFTLLEILMVLAILSLITFIALPAINESRKNAQIEQLKSEMITKVLDLQNYIEEKEAISNNYSVVGAHFYNSMYYQNNTNFEYIINEIYDSFPKYLSAEIECGEDDSGKFLKISISYPGYTTQGMSRLKNISEIDLAQGYFRFSDTIEVFNDISGCTWEAYNNKLINLPNGDIIELTKLSITTRVYDLNNNNNHVILSLQHLEDQKR